MKKDHIYYLICAGIAIFHILVNSWWLNVDDQLPFFDPAYHFLETYEYGKEILNFSFQSFYRIIELGSVWAPLTRFLMGPFIYLFDLKIDAAVLLMNIIFLPILIFSVFKIGQILLDSRAGILAAFMITMYPVMTGMTRHYNIDLALTAMIALAFLFLLKTENFNSRRYSLIFGIAAGLGILTKHAFPIFFIFPVLYTLLHLKGKKALLNSLLSGLICFFIAGPWYILVTKGAHFRYLEHAQRRFTLDAIKISLQTYDFYFFEFINKQASFIYFSIFLICAMIFLFKYRDLRKKLLLFFWIIFIYLIITAPFFMGPRNVRYDLPILLPVTLVIATAIFTIKRAVFRRTMVFLTIGYAFLQFAANAFEMPMLTHRYAVNFNDNEVVLFSQHTFIDLAYNTRPEKGTFYEQDLEKVFKIFAGQEKIEKHVLPPNVLVLSQYPPFNIGAFKYYALVNKKSFLFYQIFDWSLLGYHDVQDMMSDEKFTYFVYMMPSGKYNLDARYSHAKEAGYAWLQTNPEGYIIVEELDLSGGKKAIIYKNEKTI